MAQIRCPQCGQVENWDLGGSFLVTCDRCGQQFTVVIARGRPPSQKENRVNSR